MKKFFFSFAAIVALLATSCVKEAKSDLTISGEEVLTTFSIRSTGIGTRAGYNDGAKATQLTYAIYDEDWKYLDEFVVDNAFDSDLKAEVKVRLVKNKKYNFVFWAQNPAATCYVLDLKNTGADATNPTVVNYPSISVDYTKLASNPSNNDNLDAFFGKELEFVAGSAQNGKTVELKRPFAQINFGTDDLEAAKNMGYDIANATVSFKTKAYTKMYLNDGAVADNMVEVNFTSAPVIDKSVDAKSLSTNKGDFHWVSMNYILWPTPDVAADASRDLSLPICQITLNMTNQEPITIEVPNAPAQRNWRTNLVGLLLTEEQLFEVVILPTPENSHDKEI